MTKALLSYSLDDLKSILSTIGIKPFVAKQIFNWVYTNHVTSFDQMKNVSKKDQELLKTHFHISPFKDVQFFPSKEENAVKMVLTLRDGQSIEAVVLKEKGYNNLCVSSQAGCAVDCKFCLTGVAGFKRQLKAEEIVGQIYIANSLGYPISQLVFMGMGEPMLNFDEVFKAIDHVTDESTYNIGKRRITVSTSGYLKGIERLIESERYINLAFSVGCADPVKRERIMPIETRNPFVKVIKTLHEYQSLHNRKLTLEYTLLDGVNDEQRDLQALANLSKYLNAKINLINLNPHAKIPFRPVSEKKILSIKQWFVDQKLPVTVRYKKGQDITAACGQLGESILAEKK